jgi:hypothetical protein
MPAPNTAPIPQAMWDRYEHARQMVEQWSEVVATTRAQIEEKLGENEFGTIRSRPVVSWKHTKSNVFDQAAHKREHPDCHALYTTVREGRRFVRES